MRLARTFGGEALKRHVLQFTGWTVDFDRPALVQQTNANQFRPKSATMVYSSMSSKRA